MKKLKSLWLFFIFYFFRKIYAIKIAKTKSEKEKVFRFRYEIYRLELAHYFLDDKEAKNGMIYDDYDFDDENTIILYSGNIDNITGTLRISAWDRNVLPPYIKNKYKVSDDLLNNFERIGELRYLQVKKNKRKSYLATMLLFSIYLFPFKNHKTLCDIFFGNCQPGLLPVYEKLGFFVFSKKMMHEQYGILQIPIALTPLDYKYLKKSNALFYFISKYYFNCVNKNVIVSNKCFDLAETIPHISLHNNNIQALRKNIPNENSKKIFDILTAYLKNPIVIPLSAETVIIKKDIVDYDLFFILSGKVGIFIEDKIMTQLGVGDIIGEMAFFNSQHQRHADAKCLTDCQILLVPRNLLKSFIEKNPKEAVSLLFFLGNILVNKLEVTNNLLLQNIKNQNNHEA